MGNGKRGSFSFSFSFSQIQKQTPFVLTPPRTPIKLVKINGILVGMFEHGQ